MWWELSFLHPLYISRFHWFPPFLWHCDIVLGYLLGQEKQFQRLLLGLLHYASSYSTGQEQCMEIIVTVKYVNLIYTLGTPESISELSEPIVSQTLAITPFITWPLYVSIPIGDPQCCFSFQVSLSTLTLYLIVFKMWLFSFPQCTVIQISASGQGPEKALLSIYDMMFAGCFFLRFS